MAKTTIGIIGCGNMGEAILRNLKAHAQQYRLLGADVDARKRRRLQRTCRVAVYHDNKQLVKKSDIIILAIKPQEAAAVLNDISPAISRRQVLISIMAGVSRSAIKRMVKRPISVIRVMPNMPAVIGEGITAVCRDGLSAANARAVRRIFSCIGDVVFVKEKDLDAVTAISGSGPAYFFYLAEVLIKAAQTLGLDRQTARALALKTAYGSSALLLKSKEDPALLRRKVTSKGGTTEAAFTVFYKKGLAALLQDGITKARNRSRQLRRQ